MKFIMLVLTFVSLILFGVYLYIIFIGKNVSKTLKTNSRFIWNNLKIKNSNNEKEDVKRIHIIMDNENLYLSSSNILDLNDKIKNDDFSDVEIIDLKKISKFEYKNKYTNSFSSAITSITNRILAKNSFILYLEYLDKNNNIIKYELTDTFMDSMDFVSTFIDFDHTIYKNRVLENDVNKEKNENIKEESKEEKEDKTILLKKQTSTEE